MGHGMDLEDSIAVVGFLLLTTGFGLNAVGMISREGTAYLLLNTVGPAILARYAWLKMVPVFFALEGLWTLIAVITLAGRARRHRRTAKGAAASSSSEPSVRA